LTQEDQIISMLNQAEYLYLRHVCEPRENSLRLVVEEATVNRSRMGEASASAGQFSEILKDASPIEATAGCRTFALHWDRYAAYLVTEELVGGGGDHGDEMYTGTLFRVYSKSHFLDHLARDTGGHIEPLTHYKLICQNHLIDVASYGRPEIRLLDTKAEDDRETKVRAN
jgi:hypothetical protein